MHMNNIRIYSHLTYTSERTLDMVSKLWTFGDGDRQIMTVALWHDVSNQSKRGK